MKNPTSRFREITCIAAICFPLSAFGQTVGKLSMERWENLPEDASVPALQRGAIALRPAEAKGLQAAATPISAKAREGIRLRAVITPKISGAYTFQVTGGVNAEIHVSSDASRFKKKLVATRRADRDEATAVRLEAGRRYFMEVLLVERGAPGSRSTLEWTCTAKGKVTHEAMPEAVFASLVSDPLDKDDDNLPDVWEKIHGLDAANALGASGEYGDPDNDGILNGEEFRIGTDPQQQEELADGVTRERWEGTAGDGLADFTGSRRFHILPDERCLIPNIDEVSKAGQAATRYRGTITPEASGPCTFWIDGSGEAELWLADGSVRKQIDGKLTALTNRYGKQRIASVSDAGPDEARNFDRQTAQRSRVIQLEGGKTYYLEVLHQTGDSRDRVAVAWQPPGKAREILPAKVLTGDVPEVDDPDDDGLPTAWEIANGLNPNDNGTINPQDGEYGDIDGDGLTNLEEFQLGSDPQKKDTLAAKGADASSPGEVRPDVGAMDAMSAPALVAGLSPIAGGASVTLAAKAASVMTSAYTHVDYSSQYSVILGPVSRIYEPLPDGSYNTKNSWFPDSHFPLITGGANEPAKTLSWWIDRKESNPPSLDHISDTPGAQWIAHGPLHSGDYRGYWLITAYRPVDYKASLAGTTVTLTIYNNNNTEPPGSETYVIDANYLVGYAHIEDYDPVTGKEKNGARLVYSYDNGLTWKHGPNTTSFANVIDNRTDPTNPRAIALGGNKLIQTTDLATGVTWDPVQTIDFLPGGVNKYAYVQSLFYNRYFGRWMSWNYLWGDRDKTTMALSDNFVDWDWGGQMLYNTGSPANILDGQGDYPTVLGSLTVTGNYDAECGQMAWLYNNHGGLSGQAMHFINKAPQAITWTPTGGSTALGTAGNWAITGGGSLAGFTDEKQSLIFGGAAGGTLGNTIPTTNRLRGITFASTAGGYTINGNTLQMEATRVSTGSGSVTGITNQSPNLQAIGADIDVRTAALFVNAQAGDLSLAGVDMRGSGGIVIYGTHDTSIGGVVSDTGYKDFTTGTSETIASANPGRLVKLDSGLLALGGANTFPGRTDVNAGTIRLDHSLALQNSIVSVNVSGGLALTTDSTVGGLNGTGGFSLGSHNLTVGNSKPADCYPSDHTGVITGSGGFVKTGSNVQRLGGANTYSGGTTLNGGVLEVTGGASAMGTGTITFGGGTLRSTSAMSLSNAVNLGSGGLIDTNGNSVALGGVVSGTGSLETFGTGTLSLNGANTYSGGTLIRNTVRVSSSSALGSGGLTLAGGTLQIGANLNLGSQAITVTASGSTIDTGSYTLTSSGAISVGSSYNLTKKGTGAFAWGGDGSAFDGDFIVESGSILYTRSGSPLTFADGNVVLKGSTLSIAPPGSGGTPVVNLAQTSGKNVQVQGAGNLVLDKGANSSLTVNIGSVANTNALVRSAGATFVMTPVNVPDLGSTVKVFVPGTANTAAGDTFSPGALVTSASSGQGDFVQYGSTNGFSAFSGYQTTASTTFPLGGSAATDVMNFTATTTTLGANAISRGIRLNGTSKLALGSYTYTVNGSGTQAGVILNGGTISGGTLAFGTQRGFIQTGSSSGVTLSSKLTGSGGLTFFGTPGTVLTLNNSSNTFSGNISVNGALVSVSTVASLGDASNTITLDGQGILRVQPGATYARSLIVGSGGGAVDVASGSSAIVSNGVTGSGTFSKTGAGTVQLNGANTFSGRVQVRQGTLTCNGTGTLNTSTATIEVESGATAQLYTWASGSPVIPNNFVINGFGTSGTGGALAIQGANTAGGTITLAGDAMIKGSLILPGTAGGKLTGLITSPGYDLTIDSSGGWLQVNGPMALGSGDLILAGGQGTTFSGVSNFSGTTTISSGGKVTLSGQFQGTSGVTVNGTLNGSGVIVTPGTVTVSSSGILSPGLVGTPNMFTVNGDFALNLGGELQSQVLNAGASTGGGTSTGYGQLVVLGSGTLAGKLRLTVDVAYTPIANEQLFVALRNGGSGQFSDVIVNGVIYSGAPGTSITVNGVVGTLQYNASSSQALTSGGYDVVINF